MASNLEVKVFCDCGVHTFLCFVDFLIHGNDQTLPFVRLTSTYLVDFLILKVIIVLVEIGQVGQEIWHELLQLCRAYFFKPGPNTLKVSFSFQVTIVCYRLKLGSCCQALAATLLA